MELILILLDALLSNLILLSKTAATDSKAIQNDQEIVPKTGCQSHVPRLHSLDLEGSCRMVFLIILVYSNFPSNCIGPT